MSRDAHLEIITDGLTFPEGPRWHEGRLWFSDFYSHRVLALDPAGELECIVEVENQPSGLGWTPDGRLLVVSMLDRKLMRLDNDGLREVADLSELAPSHCNDMVVDNEGRAYVGNFGFDRHQGEAPRSTTLVRVEADGRTSIAADELRFPNGAVITPDGGTLIIGETGAGRLTAFDIADDGALENRRPFAQFDDVAPDGICLDEEGAIWVADPRGNRVVRSFEGGRIEREISTGDQGSFACMLGGADRRTLYICTAADSGAANAAKKSGRIEAIPVEVPGTGLP